MTNPRILSHRGCLSGRLPGGENTLQVLDAAIRQGFDVEFDIQQSPASRKLVLSHDVEDWSAERDAVSFLTQHSVLSGLASPDFARCHALNVKSLDTVEVITEHIQRAGAQSRFFLFDFELLTNDLTACRTRMRGLTAQGFQVAYRVSEREPYLEEYLNCDYVERIWLDEMDGPWVTRDHICKLSEYGKAVYYVSPELHARLSPEQLPCRWEQVIAWGASAICTDYPLLLEQFASKILNTKPNLEP